MNLIKLIGKIGPVLAGRGMKNENVNQWTKINPKQDEHIPHGKGASKLTLNILHERNGSRGNGQGLGRQQQHHHKPK